MPFCRLGVSELEPGCSVMPPSVPPWSRTAGINRPVLLLIVTDGKPSPLIATSTSIPGVDRSSCEFALPLSVAAPETSRPSPCTASGAKGRRFESYRAR